uniref:CUB domain-containing protein n=1 Tax=Anas platyrhynchos TaxID=8839 RepID=A0A8B9TTJ8_ANAPL
LLSAAPYFCGGLISNSSGMQVNQNFWSMLTSRCQYDYIEVYDGPPHSSPLLGRICAGSFLTYTSSSNLMSIHFHSDSRHTFRGLPSTLRKKAAFSSIKTFNH